MNFPQTLVEEFAKHAPAEPQEWFQPVMRERPAVRSISLEPDEELRKRLRCAVDAELDPENMDPDVGCWLLAQEEEQEAADQWRLEAKKQRLVQWPWAWAYAVLNARSSLNGGASDG